MRKISLLLLLLVGPCVIHAQFNTYENYNASHFAKAIRLGGAYTGVAEGAEATFYNAAGLAFQENYSVVVSQGQGLALFKNSPHSLDYAAVVPLPYGLGAIGISLNTHKIIPAIYSLYEYSFGIISLDDFNYKSKVENKLVGLSYAKQITPNLSAAITLNYYSTKFTFDSSDYSKVVTDVVNGRCYDLNLAFLYKTPESISEISIERFQIGLQLKNILNAKIKYDNKLADLNNFQNVRAGFAYSVKSNFGKWFGLTPIRLLASGDALLKISDYKLDSFIPCVGIELTLMEIFQISCGREEEIEIDDQKINPYQYPAFRYGIGISLPVHKVIGLFETLAVDFNYTVSDWKYFAETGVKLPPTSEMYAIDKKAYSLSVSWKL